MPKLTDDITPEEEAVLIKFRQAKTQRAEKRKAKEEAIAIKTDGIETREFTLHSGVVVGQYLRDLVKSKEPKTEEVKK